MRTLKTIQDCKDAGARAVGHCAIRLAPLADLLTVGGMAAVDAWYEGYDEARGAGPYFGTTAQAEDAVVGLATPLPLDLRHDRREPLVAFGRREDLP